MRGQYRESRTNKLYQWLSRRASIFGADTSSGGIRRTVRTEVRVERRGLTLLMGSAAAGLEICPLCGQNLAPSQSEQAKLRLREGSIPQRDLLGDGRVPSNTVDGQRK